MCFPTIALRCARCIPSSLHWSANRSSTAPPMTYASTYPSRSGDLNDFGGEFGDFLAGWPPAAQLPYLPDVARLEWAVERVFHAAEVPPLDLSRLAGVPQEELPGLRFALHPGQSDRLLALPDSAYLASESSRFHRRAERGPWGRRGLAAGDPPQRHRRAGAPFTRANWSCLQALAGDLTLAQAHARALEADPGLDLTALLQHHVLGGTLIAFRNHKGVTT